MKLGIAGAWRQLVAVAGAAGLATVGFQGTASADEYNSSAHLWRNGSSGAQRVVSFSGFDVSKDAHSFYSGSLVALNGDFSRDGLIFRAIGISSDYEYNEITVPGGRVDADDRTIDVMIGYQRSFGSFTATGYIGFEYRDIDLSPADPFNEIQGSEAGFKVALDAQTHDDIPLFLSFSGAYSTAFDAYYALGRIGYNMKRFVLGAEGLLGGIEDEEYQRVGGFATFRFNLTPTMPAELTLNAGHQFVDDDNGNANGFSTTTGGEGAYGGVSFSFSF